MKKKIWLTLGATLVSLIPITATIACGSNASKSISEDEIKRKKEERRLEDLAREKARKNRAAKVEKENLINNFYENVRSSMPSRYEVKFNKFGDPDWDNNIDLANYGNLSFQEIQDEYDSSWSTFRYPDNFYHLDILIPPYISPIEIMTERFINEKDKTQFFTLDEAINYINNANSSEYESIINWLDKKADRDGDSDDVITAKIAKLNKQLDQEISKDAAGDLKITNLNAQQVDGNLELKITLDSTIFTNADLDLDTTEPLEFKYNISGSNFLHPSFKNLLNETAELQKALNDVKLKLKLDDIHLKNMGLDTDMLDYAASFLTDNRSLREKIDTLFDTNKVRDTRNCWPVWKETTGLKSALEWINGMNDFAFENLASLPEELENYKVIGAKLNWDYYNLSNEVDGNSIKLYFQHNDSSYQFYSLRLPFIVDSKIYIMNHYLSSPNFIVKDSSMWKIFEKAYFDLEELKPPEQAKLDAFVEEKRFIQRLQEDMTDKDNKKQNLEEIKIVIWDEEKEEPKYLKVTLKNPHSYEPGEPISWKKDFETYLLVEDKFSCKEISNEWID